MANDEHLSVLLQGRQHWNEWREANPAVKPDLRKVDLHAADLSGVNLSCAMLNDADLHQACLRGANLAGANLRHADLRQTDFQSADLHGAVLAKTDLRDANLKEADIREADMREARLPGAALEGADLKGAVLNKDGFRYVSLHNDQPHPAPDAVPSTPGAAQPAEIAAKGPRLKFALAGGGLLLAVGLGGFVATRPARPVDARVPQAVSKAIAESSDIESVKVEGQTLILRSGHKQVESGMYLGLLKTACEALQQMQPANNGLREIRITNQSGQEGWIYGAPHKCGEVLTKPAALTALSIAADTQPIRNR